MRVGTWIGIGAVVLTTMGCGAGPESTCESSVDDAAREVARAYCDVVARCGWTATAEASFGTSLEDCATTVGQRLADAHYRRLAAAVDRGTADFDACALSGCAAAIRAQACGLSPYPDLETPSCNAMFSGALPDGVGCSFTEECADTSICNGAHPTCPAGECMHVPQLGETCTLFGCAQGAVCESGTCVARDLLVGARCDATSASVRCAPDLSCRPDGTCAAFEPIALGAPCGPGTNGRCAPGLVCEGPGSTCRAARTDGTCHGDYYVETADCGVGTRCVREGEGDGACVAYPALGEACDGLCRAPGVCLLGACTTLRADGQPCSQWNECAGDACTDGVCGVRALCDAP